MPESRLDHKQSETFQQSPLYQLDREPPTLDCWQKQQNTWEQVLHKFKMPNNRYKDFEFFKYLDLCDPFVINYILFQLELVNPRIVGQLKHSLEFVNI